MTAQNIQNWVALMTVVLTAVSTVGVMAIVVGFKVYSTFLQQLNDIKSNHAKTAQYTAENYGTINTIKDAVTSITNTVAATNNKVVDLATLLPTSSMGGTVGTSDANLGTTIGNIEKLVGNINPITSEDTTAIPTGQPPTNIVNSMDPSVAKEQTPFAVGTSLETAGTSQSKDPSNTSSVTANIEPSFEDSMTNLAANTRGV